jgi:CheY-like chemotaxis protein
MSVARNAEFDRAALRPEAAGTHLAPSCAKISSVERHQNKPMDRSHCPLGSLREEAHKTAAIGLRIAMDNLRLRWSERGQMAYDEAQKTADDTLASWNYHIRNCEICCDATPALVAAGTNSGIVTAPTLLIVDDNHDLLELLVQMLQHTYKIAATLSKGVAVVEQAAALHPDLIILDISLGDMSGFEVARRLKKAGCPAKIIFLSLHEDMDFVRAGFGLGASGYVFKSRLCLELENAIAAVLGGGQFSSIS